MGMFDKMKDAKNMYSNIKKAQNEINKIKVEGSAGAGAVRVTVKGNHQIVSIEVDNDTRTHSNHWHGASIDSSWNSVEPDLHKKNLKFRLTDDEY